MTDGTRKSKRLSYEILGLFAICFVISLLLFLFLSFFCVGIIEQLLFDQGIELDENQLYHLDSVVFNGSLFIAVAFFVILFVILFGEKLSYIRTIIKGVDAVRSGNYCYNLPIHGNNELTRLAEAVNYLSESERAVKERERKLGEEREELIRTLSHDIRTPLTSILSYSELMCDKAEITDAEMKEYLTLVRQKALQIKDMTDILLDGGKRNAELFDDAKLLMEQLAGEFEEMLDDSFDLSVDILGCDELSGYFDVQELRRVFDNLASNVKKYADPKRSVELVIEKNEQDIQIKQKNAVNQNAVPGESYKMGINSIRRIAQSYDGSAEVIQNDDFFEIIITLSKF